MQVEKVAAIEKTVTGHIADTKDRMGKQGALFQKVKESLRQVQASQSKLSSAKDEEKKAENDRDPNASPPITTTARIDAEQFFSLVDRVEALELSLTDS